MAKFDSSLGNLVNVFFAIDGGISGQISGSDSQNNAVGVTISRTVTANVGAPSLSTLSATPVSDPGIEKVGSFNNFVEFSGNNSLNSTNLTSTADLNFFTGTGNFSVLTETSARVENPSGQIVGDVDGLSNATIAVRYTYETVDQVTPVPLPAAGWALFAALGSLVAFRRYSKA